MPPARKKTIAMPDRPKEEPTHAKRGQFIADDVETYQALDEEIQGVEAALKRLKDERDDFERYIIDRMTYERVPSLPVHGRTFYVNHQRFAKVQDRAAFVRWAEENEPELLATVKEKKGDLNTAVRRIDDDSGEMPDGVGIYWDTKLGSRAR